MPRRRRPSGWSRSGAEPARGRASPSAAHSASIGAVSAASSIGAIEDDRHHRPAGASAAASRSRSTAPSPRQISGNARHGLRLCGLERTPGMAGQPAQAARADCRGRPRGSSAAACRAPAVARSKRRRAARSSRSSPGSTASAMPRSRARAESRSMPYFHQSRPPSRRTRITLACAPTRSIHRSTDIGWRRSRRCASRTLGSAFALDRPGRRERRRDRCRRTTARRYRPAAGRDRPASTISSRLVELVASRCIAQPERARASQRRDPALQADHDEAALHAPRPRPRPVILMRDPRADRLHQKPHRLAGDGGKALDAQHVELLRERRRRAPRALQGRRSRRAARRSCRNRRGRALPRHRDACGGWRCRPRCRRRARAAAPDRPCRRATVTTLTLRGSASGDRRAVPVARPASSSRSRLLSTTRSAQAIWSSNTSSTGSS